MSETTAYALYLVFALGGAGVYLLLPRSGQSKALVGGVIGVSAIIGLLTVLALRVVARDSSTAYFYPFAAIAVVGAGRVITHPKPVYCALYFVMVVVAVAALLVLQQAEFLAVALIIIYAGAILVTYLFVIMLARQSGAPTYDRAAREPFLSVVAGFVLMAAIAGKAGDLPPTPPAPTGALALAANADAAADAIPSIPEGNTAAIGALVMTKYVVALELGGILLLVSMIGAIALSRKKIRAEGPDLAKPALGEVGREAPPF